MVTLRSPNAHFKIPNPRTISKSKLHKIGNGRQVNVYRIPKHNLVIKIPREDIESGEPEKRVHGLELIITYMPETAYAPTIYTSEKYNFHFVEFQEYAEKMYLEHLHNLLATEKENGFSEGIRKLLNYEKTLWMHKLFLADWAGQFDNFCMNGSTLKLIDFGSVIDKKDDAVRFIDTETNGKINDVIQWLTQNKFSSNCMEIYEKQAREIYKVDALLNIWQ